MKYPRIIAIVGAFALVLALALSNSNAGLVSYGGGGGSTSTAAPTPTITLGGDVTGASNANSITLIRGQSMASPTGSPGNALQVNSSGTVVWTATPAANATATPFAVNGSPVPATASPQSYLVTGPGGSPSWAPTPAAAATQNTTYGGLTTTNVAPTVPATSTGFTSTGSSANATFPSATKLGCLLIGDAVQTTSTSVTPNDWGTLEVRTPASSNPIPIMDHWVNNEAGLAAWANTSLGQSILVAACQGPPYGIPHIDCHNSNIVADATSSTGPTCTTTTNNDLCLAWAVHVGSGNTITFSSIPNSGASITSLAAAGNEVAQFNQAVAGVTTAVVAADSGTSGKGWFNGLVCISPTGN